MPVMTLEALRTAKSKKARNRRKLRRDLERRRDDFCPWVHALKAPISRATKYEALELMRLDLLSHLDFVSGDCADDGAKARRWAKKTIEKITGRLLEISSLIVRAAQRAREDGRVEYDYEAERRGHVTDPAPERDWQRSQDYWKRGLDAADEKPVADNRTRAPARGKRKSRRS